MGPTSGVVAGSSVERSSVARAARAARIWKAALAAGLVACAVYLVLPERYVFLREIVLYAGAEFTAVAAILVGIRLHRPVPATSWYLIGGGLGLWAIGDLLWGIYEVLGSDPWPSAADVFYIAGYPALAAGLALAVRRWGVPGDRDTLIDAAIVTVGLGFAAAIFLVESYHASGAGDRLEAVVSVAYPIGDVLLLAVAAAFLFSGVWQVPTFRFLLGALVLTLVADAAYALGVLTDVVHGERYLNTALMVGIVFYATAGLHPSMRALVEGARARRRELGPERVIVLAASALVPTAVLIVQAIRGELIYIPASIAAVVTLAALIVARFAALTARARRAANREAALREYAGGLMAATTREELFAAAQSAAESLVEDGEARLVVDADGDHAFAAPVSLHGETVASLVVDGRRARVRPMFQSLDTVVAQLELALDRERLLAQERATADALAEQNERLVELDRMKDQFVSTVSHELRTPLTSMVGYLELVLAGETGELTPEQRRFLEIVNRNSLRLNALIDDILFSARVDAGRQTFEFEPVDVCALAAASVESARVTAEQRGIELRLSTPDEMPPLVADGSRVGQLLDNLVSNAIKFTREGGAVTVAVSQRGEAAQLEVRDTGVGIPANEVDHVFERFFRASTGSSVQGTGLGLSIVKAIADAHGGKVSLSSEEGVGTVFDVELPLQGPESETAAAEPAEAPA